MELFILLLKATIFLLEVGLGILVVVGVSYMGVMIYDEITSRNNDFYEFKLATIVQAERLLKSLSMERKAPKSKYHGHHRLDDPFIDDLVVEMRQVPTSLCYRPTLNKRKAVTA